MCPSAPPFGPRAQANPEQNPPLYIESLRALCASTAAAVELDCGGGGGGSGGGGGGGGDGNGRVGGHDGNDSGGVGSVTIINTAGWVQGLGLRYVFAIFVRA